MCKKTDKHSKGRVRGAALTHRLSRDEVDWSMRVKIPNKSKTPPVPYSEYIADKEQTWIVKKPKNYINMLDETSLEVFYNILRYLTSPDIMNLARTSRKYYKQILYDDVLSEEFSQNLYLDRWFTLLSRKVGLSLGRCSFYPDEDVSHLTYNQKCVMIFIRGILDGGLNCKHLPPFFQEKFDSKLACSELDNCGSEEEWDNSDYGIAPWIFAERTHLTHWCWHCNLIMTRKCEEIKVFKNIKDKGCPYCEKPFTLGDVNEGDSRCDICGSYHEAGYRANYRCMGDCLSDTRKWINYCESCWENINPNFERRKHDLELCLENNDIYVKFNEDAKDIFVKQGNLIKLFQRDRQFFALNYWYMFVNELMEYNRLKAIYGTYSFEDFMSHRKEWVPYSPPVPGW